MKKKSPRGIPDFAPKKPQSGPLSKFTKDKSQLRPTTQPQNIKPQATSAKGGRRGQ